MKHYVYRHMRNDLGIPFYIGIGSKRDMAFRTHKQEYERAFKFNPGHRSSYWINVFNQCNKDISVEILFESNSYEEIKEKENEFIALYGRRDNNNGILVNLTDGGEGGIGVHRSDEWRRKISLSKTGKKQNPEVIAKRVAARKGYKHSEETKEKIRQKHIGKKYKGTPRTEEQKLKLSTDRKGIRMGWKMDIVTRKTSYDRD